MPGYFIDTDDGDLYVKGEEGHELSGPDEARAIAIRSLPDMAREKMPNGDHRVFTVSVRDEAGALLYIATLTFDGRWRSAEPS